MVRSMAAYGIRQEEIARCLGLRSAKTLRRHFREELEPGRPGEAFEMALLEFDQHKATHERPD